MKARERLFALEQFGIKLGLDNIRTLLAALDHPERAFRSIHIAGTNGKGSVTAMVERGLRSAGHRTGRYTSPHLARIEERVAIDGEAIGSVMFDDVTAHVLQVVDGLRASGALPHPPTFFEVTTAIAFELFRRAGVSVGVIEVGLGGRFDATNVVEPVVTAITSIALDHERHLGSTVEQIAFEKAGIIKRAVPVVIGAIADPPRDVILMQAETLDAPVVSAGAEHVSELALDRGTATVALHTPSNEYPPIRLGLNGVHQAANAVVAARVMEVAADRGLPSREEDVVAGLRDVDWPARLEWLRTAEGGFVLIDAAHNPAGAAALAEYLHAAGVAPIPLLLSVMKDKDVDAIVHALAPAVSVVIATQATSPRALAADDLATRVAAAAPGVHVEPSADPERAIRRALREHPRVVVAGSMFLAGPLRAYLIANGAVRTMHPE